MIDQVYPETIEDTLSLAQSMLDEMEGMDNPLYPVVQKLVLSVRALERRLNRISAISDHYQAQLKNKNELLSEAAHTDLLTNLPNRRDMMDRLLSEINRSERFSHPFGILIVDIDHFKHINDTYGHIAGDSVLVDIAKLMRQTLRNSDTCARWGGEEFLVLLPEANASSVWNAAERLRKTVESQVFSYGDYSISITVSIGAVSVSAVRNLDELLQSADSMLYQSKIMGRNQVQTAEV